MHNKGIAGDAFYSLWKNEYQECLLVFLNQGVPWRGPLFFFCLAP